MIEIFIFKKPYSFFMGSNKGIFPVKYPTRKKGEWFRTELKKNKPSNSFASIIFTKSYLSFLIDVQILQQAEGLYCVEGRVFSFAVNQKNERCIQPEKLTEKECFSGPEAYTRSMSRAVRMGEELESFCENINPLPLSVDYPEKSEGDWLESGPVNEQGKNIVAVFSKEYMHFLCDVIVVKKGSEFYVRGRIFDKKRNFEVVYSSPRHYFSSRNKAMSQAEKEKKAVEKSVLIIS